jgi:hypothetical protein|tara:strand:+ start:2042 stop:2308 length:267 start_codon:yes stop_codon:yes gene_type:complete
MIKVIANTAILNATHVEQTNRFVRIVNTHATSVANVEIGSAVATVQKTINLDGGEAVVLDLGQAGGVWLSLNTDVATCYVTAVAGGSS